MMQPSFPVPVTPAQPHAALRLGLRLSLLLVIGLPTVVAFLYQSEPLLDSQFLHIVSAAMSWGTVLFALAITRLGWLRYRNEYKITPLCVGLSFLALALTKSIFALDQETAHWDDALTSTSVAAVYLASAVLVAVSLSLPRPGGMRRSSWRALVTTLFLPLLVYWYGTEYAHWMKEQLGDDLGFRFAAFGMAAALYAYSAWSLKFRTQGTEVRLLFFSIALLALAALCQLAAEGVSLVILSAQGYRLLAYGMVYLAMSAWMRNRQRATDSAEGKGNVMAEAPSAQTDPALLASLAQFSPDLVAVSDGNGHLRYLNPKGRQILNLRDDANISDLQIGQLFPQGSASLHPLGEQPGASAWRGETLLQRPSGDCVPVLETLVLKHGMLPRWLITAHDLSERDQAHQDLWHTARHDALTHLPNRYFLDELLAGACASVEQEGGSLALICIHVGRFKDVNDIFGQQVGDSLLRDLASRLNQVAGEPGALARIGGTEFCLLIRNAMRPDDISRTMDKLREQVANPVRLADKELRFTCSMGAAFFPRDAHTPEQLFNAAEIALRHAKRNGGRRCEFYNHLLDQEVREHVLLESHLRLALDNDELRLEFQPQIRLSDGQVSGVEALLRWRHPHLGLVRPDRFIPIAEASGLIIPIGDWVLRTACYQQVAWQRSGHPPLRMAINLSAYQFRDPELLNRIEDAIAYSGIAPDNMELELTESVLMEDASSAKALMAKLSGMGVRTAIDDFGTGYSSLAYLKEFPLDRIKIDRCFVSDLPRDENLSIITRSILSLAQGLGMGTIAEGVEKEEQIDFLRSNGCEELQGFLLSRPLSATQLEEFVENHEGSVAMLEKTGLHDPTPIT